MYMILFHDVILRMLWKSKTFHVIISIMNYEVLTECIDNEY